jgi:ABC-type transport system substrate-binding protein
VNDADQIPPHGNNMSFYANAELTRLENEAAATPVIAQRKVLYDRIQVIELRELPYYVIRWSEITDMRSADLEGVRPPLIGSTFWNVADWKFRP